jgi:diaminopimelate decarboxylase
MLPASKGYDMFPAGTTAELERQATPLYYYDIALLEETLQQAAAAAGRHHYSVHYALKANTRPEILERMRAHGFGADCVSGGEVKAAVAAGFRGEDIVFAGVGKSDDEMRTALEHDILCFNCESVQEIEVLNGLAQQAGRRARIALRLNPNVHADTHQYITTGLEENKFGINPWELTDVLGVIGQSQHVELTGLHFHIGSQITTLEPFRNLCMRVNELQEWFAQRQVPLPHVNLGGGLGINYHEPDREAVPDFAAFFGVFRDFLEVRDGQEVHFELGRALVGQCGALLSRVLFVKKGVNKNFLILDAGMTELIRPALYQSYHRIENISPRLEGLVAPELHPYDVVGPVCESSDCFGKVVELPESFRGDLIAIRSTGAYGEVMSNNYNLREKAGVYFKGLMFKV